MHHMLGNKWPESIQPRGCFLIQAQQAYGEKTLTRHDRGEAFCASFSAEVALRKFSMQALNSSSLRKLVCARFSAKAALCKILCESCSEISALVSSAYDLHASFSAKLHCASASVQVVCANSLRKFIYASTSLQVLDTSFSAQLLGASFVAVALKSCDVTLQKLPADKGGVEHAPPIPRVAACRPRRSPAAARELQKAAEDLRCLTTDADPGACDFDIFRVQPQSQFVQLSVASQRAISCVGTKCVYDM